MPTLVVPGVRVEARFDVLPPLPAPSGIIGIVGIVDRPPSSSELVGVTSVPELRELLGPGTLVSLPEAVHALANGASEVVVAPVRGGRPAALTLRNADSAPVALLRCRSNGTWGNRLAADVRVVADASGTPVRASLRLLLDNQVVESFADLQTDPTQPDYLFDVINQRSRYIVAIDPGFATALPAENTYAFATDAESVLVPRAGATNNLLELLPGDGIATTALAVRVDNIEANQTTTIQVFQGGLQEEFSGLVLDPDSNAFLPAVLLTQSRFIQVRMLSSLAANQRLPRATTAPDRFADGESPTPDQYADAIDLLADDPRIDLVLAAVEPGRSEADTRLIHQRLLAHAVAMSENGAPRIAFGSVTRAEQANLNAIRDHAATVRNRRFVLVSPAGAEGAVAGMVARMNPQESPTFKAVPLFGLAAARYRESELNRLLGPATNLCVVQDRAGRGVVVLRGIDTTGDQISVTRVADLCIRETKAISENFIGRLNTAEARTALQQQIIATFTRLERGGALVPSTDGSDPAFVVNVYSTQLDFAQGIVRVDIAVRPVRAIDYIYATIRVKN